MQAPLTDYSGHTSSLPQRGGNQPQNQQPSLKNQYSYVNGTVYENLFDRYSHSLNEMAKKFREPKRKIKEKIVMDCNNTKQNMNEQNNKRNSLISLPKLKTKQKQRNDHKLYPSTFRKQIRDQENDIRKKISKISKMVHDKIYQQKKFQSMHNEMVYPPLPLPLPYFQPPPPPFPFPFQMFQKQNSSEQPKKRKKPKKNKKIIFNIKKFKAATKKIRVIIYAVFFCVLFPKITAKFTRMRRQYVQSCQNIKNIDKIKKALIQKFQTQIDLYSIFEQKFGGCIPAFANSPIQIDWQQLTNTALIPLIFLPPPPPSFPQQALCNIAQQLLQIFQSIMLQSNEPEPYYSDYSEHYYKKQESDYEGHPEIKLYENLAQSLTNGAFLHDRFCYKEQSYLLAFSKKQCKNGSKDAKQQFYPYFKINQRTQVLLVIIRIFFQYFLQGFLFALSSNHEYLQQVRSKYGILQPNDGRLNSFLQALGFVGSYLFQCYRQIMVQKGEQSVSASNFAEYKQRYKIKLYNQETIQIKPNQLPTPNIYLSNPVKNRQPSLMQVYPSPSSSSGLMVSLKPSHMQIISSMLQSSQLLEINKENIKSKIYVICRHIAKIIKQQKKRDYQKVWDNVFNNKLPKNVKKFQSQFPPAVGMPAIAKQLKKPSLNIQYQKWKQNQTPQPQHPPEYSQSPPPFPQYQNPPPQHYQFQPQPQYHPQYQQPENQRYDQYQYSSPMKVAAQGYNFIPEEYHVPFLQRQIQLKEQKRQQLNKKMYDKIKGDLLSKRDNLRVHDKENQGKIRNSDRPDFYRKQKYPPLSKNGEHLKPKFNLDTVNVYGEHRKRDHIQQRFRNIFNKKQ